MMSQIIQFKPFLRRDCAPTLVLVDVQEEFQRNTLDWAAPSVQLALSNCRAVLERMRALGGPVAFVRRVPGQDIWSTPWLPGFRPDPQRDMVFERRHPSCYASDEFTTMADSIGGDYVLAGLFGESALLATGMDASLRGHRPTYLTDAAISRAAGDLAADEVHHAINAVLEFYTDGVLTKNWIDLVLAA